jgi:murein DD-endopeptidase MepM/ murein hydrolase activator NlpD
MSKLELFYPVRPYRINQRFGENATPIYQQFGMKGHNGMDLWAPDGWPVRAAHDGVVTFAGEDGASGYSIVIRTKDKREYKDGTAYFKTLYCHLRKDGLRVTAGQHVKVGDIIALADNTGVSTGSHLHFGLKPVQKGEADWQFSNVEQDNGYRGAIDPEPYWGGLYADDFAGILQSWEEIKIAFAALFRK